jgi:hypothetical protein
VSKSGEYDVIAQSAIARGKKSFINLERTLRRQEIQWCQGFVLLAKLKDGHPV